MASVEDISTQVTRIAKEAKAASRILASASTEAKNAVLRRVAEALRGPAAKTVLEANARDMEAARANGLEAALVDRLALDEARLRGIADGVDQVCALPDPVGQTLEERALESGLHIAKMRVPLGLIGIIYESRPNVTVDASALCIKSGNAVLLRGGKEAFHSNQALAEVFASALSAEGFPTAAATLLPTVDRKATLVMIGLEGIVDVIIPRGGEGLIRFVSENARVPVLQHYKGVCHVYVDADANLDQACAIALNAKAQRPGVCNAMETLLVDEAIAEVFLPKVAKALIEKGVELRVDGRAAEMLNGQASSTAPNWDEEYLALILNVAVVSGLNGALAHIAKHGSNHTEAIITEDADKQARWLREVDASLVLVNASTRFNDGFQLGLGAEMGISTTKLHAYGPMGLNELCALKWIGRGQGLIRQ